MTSADGMPLEAVFSGADTEQSFRIFRHWSHEPLTRSPSRGGQDPWRTDAGGRVKDLLEASLSRGPPAQVTQEGISNQLWEATNS